MLRHFFFFEKTGRLYVTQCEIKKKYFGAGSSYEKYAAACVLVEVGEKILENSVEYRELFTLLTSCLFALEKCMLPDFVLAYFFSRVCLLLGVQPATEECVICGKPLPEPTLFCGESGGTVCGRCELAGRTTPVRPQDIRTIGHFLQTPPKEIAQMQEEPGAPLRLLWTYLSQTAEIESKSIRYLL